MQFDSILPSLPFILGGVGVTLKFTVTSLLCALPLAVLMALAKISSLRSLRWAMTAYTSVFRGTPLLVQLGLIYYGLPQLIGYTFSPFEAGILAFTLNSVAYTSEIMRAGIQSIDPGQWEAGKVLGLSYTQTFRTIVFPQAMRTIAPALVNEIVDLLKESALVSVIGEADLLRRTQIVAAEKYLYFEPYIIAAIGYYLMVLAVSSIAKLLEKRRLYA
ncbi:MAG: arginine ABC transporter permease [Alphaproteobacteria bacterium RIFCSPLOWO2_01_FULL_45_8]|nr:MAG: arginine ABC transporter permease [Alphaproteobacteria bacterium GWB1_45_5]OFW76022.1 MAG: arginine ABC transporter permease [Alphaproteobacteria bacterium GWA1_45_9]OFW90062.1 MAG: arginine ABC transporter permease [Alphaproteobacteria bacterium RIFCSPHIGHO2_01_FULL_41_14]OFW96282.1 MAG: arginine ABC transporter permease [Alphaproteobacteria bacterium RIFCSPLOWO2_01_FULL_45_8]HCI48561.1 arginine ABC transporter permease [Holosporales bacterium]